MDFPNCNIVYGTDLNNRNLPAVSGQQIPGLLPNETYFYLVTQTIGSQVVEVEGSFTIGMWNLCSYVLYGIVYMKEFVSQDFMFILVY